MRHIAIFLFLYFSINCGVLAQYKFKHTTEIECTEVKNQNKTGTCWSFATSSFLESEIIRMGHDKIDLSEMFVVRNIYKDKARNYVLRQGKANFSQGSLAHDLINVVSTVGLMPEEAYSGKIRPKQIHNHTILENSLKGFLDGMIKSKAPSDRWPIAFDAIMDAYIGGYETEFNYDGKKYSPASFRDDLDIKASDYINLTSFTHHPFDAPFILEIPDNYSNGSFHNIPLDQLMNNINHALDKGYTIAWDGDVSEKGFDAKKGIAVIPADEDRANLFSQPADEIKVDQKYRQEQFENYSTTDDHLMHIIGTAKDQKGTKYYIIKNSWGEIGPHDGLIYMSESYMRLKTVSVTLHKDGLKTPIKL